MSEGVFRRYDHQYYVARRNLPSVPPVTPPVVSFSATSRVHPARNPRLRDQTFRPPSLTHYQHKRAFPPATFVPGTTNALPGVRHSRKLRDTTFRSSYLGYYGPKRRALPPRILSPEILNITHNVGDLSEYTSTVTDGGDLSVTTAAALAGTSHGLSCLIDDTNDIFGLKDFTQLTSSAFRFRFYIDPNGLTMSDNNSFTLLRLRDVASTRARVFLQRSGSNYQIVFRALNDSSVDEDTAAYTISDGEHYIEGRLA